MDSKKKIIFSFSFAAIIVRGTRAALNKINYYTFGLNYFLELILLRVRRRT